ncbi:MAG: hypothetical protein ACRBDL_07030 [Alphaproteobacteria bacterium]
MTHDVFHVLRGRDVLALWEAGASLPSDRVMDMLLSAALPDGSASWIDGASIGQKNTVLLRLYHKWFGNELSACVECCSCGEKLETSVQVTDLLSVAGDALPRVHTLEDGTQMRFPNSQDVRNTDHFQDEAGASHALLRSCLIDGDEMSDNDVLRYQQEVADVIEKYDPLSLISFDLQCNDCGTRFESALDVAFFLLRNFSSLAQRILYDVHSLAQHYGWREADILDMSDTRRKAYMRLIEG